MTGTDLVLASTAYSRSDLTERQRYVGLLSQAGSLLPQHLRDGMGGNPGKTFLLCETGDMLGIHPIAAMTGVHIIEGKPSISANLMSGLVRKAGHTLRVKVTGTLEKKDLSATAQLIRVDDPDFTFEVTWTIQKAERAKLFPGKSGSNWDKYPEAMLKARAISEITREGASDVLMGGNVYTPEELGAEVDEQGEPINLPEVKPDVSRETRTAAPIVEDAPQDGAVDPRVQEYMNAVANASTSAEVLEVYQSGRTSGTFSTLIDPGDGKDRIELGQWIIDIGKALKEAEDAPVEGVIEDEAVDDGMPAVLDPNVVDAEVVDEQREREQREFEEAEVARHEAEEAAREAAEKKGRKS